MSAPALYTVRCPRCRTSMMLNTTLDDARRSVCRGCNERMTVIGHEQTPEEATQQPKPVHTAPADERLFWKLTPEKTAKARELVLSALEEED